MNFSLSNLHFSPSPWTFAFGLVVLLAVVTLALVAWRRSPHPVRTGMLECLRVLIVLLGVLLLWKPEWLTVIHPETKPRIAILVDGSGSMDTLDAELPEAEGQPAKVVTRRDWVRTVVNNDLLSALSVHGANEVNARDIATPPTDAGALAGTDLTTPISELVDAGTNLRAVILFSDGDYNLGQPPVVAAQKLRQRGIPLFAVPVGSKNRLPDLDLLRVTAPTYGIVGENVQIPFTVRSSLDREVRTAVHLKDDQGTERTKAIVLAPGVENHESILWTIAQEGSSTLELSLPVAEGERIDSNNSLKFTLAGRRELIKVLVIDSLPRWEYRYLRNALSRDPGVELSCLLFHPGLGMGQGRDYIDAFPATPEELAKYDVIFIGDVGMQAGQLTKEQCEMIAGLVENQASGVVFLPGSQGNEQTLYESPLADLIPVIPDPANPKGITDPIASPIELTGEGRGSLLTLLADTEEQNSDLWRSLPGFYWHNAVLRAKAGTQVLGVHGNRRTTYGPTPIIVTAAAGTGKVLYMGVDSAWRWRRGVEDKYHYRFWGQVARWMSYQRNMAAGQRVRLFYAPERPAPGDTVTFHANAFDAQGAPLQQGEVWLDTTRPDGAAQRLVLKKDDSQWGAFSGRLKVDQPGEWKISARIAGDDSEPVETTLLTQGVTLEKVGQPARPEVLEELARITHGRFIPSAKIADLAAEISALPEPRPIENRVALWAHWATITLMVLLLALFWAGRKLNGTF